MLGGRAELMPTHPCTCVLGQPNRGLYFCDDDDTTKFSSALFNGRGVGEHIGEDELSRQSHPLAPRSYPKMQHSIPDKLPSLPTTDTDTRHEDRANSPRASAIRRA